MILPVYAYLCLCLPLHSAQKGQYLEENKKDICETVEHTFRMEVLAGPSTLFLSHLHRKPGCYLLFL